MDTPSFERKDSSKIAQSTNDASILDKHHRWAAIMEAARRGASGLDVSSNNTSETEENIHDNGSKGDSEQDFYEKWISILKEKGMTVLAEQPNRHTPIAAVNQRWGKEAATVFAIVRGMQVREKSTRAIYRPDVTDKFNKYQTWAALDLGNRNPEEERFLVSSKKERSSCSASVDLKAGRIDIHNTKRDGNADSLHLSSQLGQMYEYVIDTFNKEVEVYKIKILGMVGINNKETEDTINIVMNEQLMSYYNEGLEEGIIKVEKGSEAFQAIVGTPSGYASLFLPREYPSLFEGGQVTLIEVKFSDLDYCRTAQRTVRLRLEVSSSKDALPRCPCPLWCPVEWSCNQIFLKEGTQCLHRRLING